jgi:hypothetical protein
MRERPGTRGRERQIDIGRRQQTAQTPLPWSFSDLGFQNPRDAEILSYQSFSI